MSRDPAHPAPAPTHAWASLSRLGPLVRRGLRQWRERSRSGPAEEALRESEEKFRAVAQSAVDAIVSVDAQGRIAFWNHAAETTFGYPASFALGAPLEILLPERLREAHREGLRRVASGGPSRIIGRTVELTGVRRDGREFPLELHSAGDHALAAVATVLKRTFRQSDVIARLGGDEFAADGSTERLLARLHENLDAHNASSGFAVSVSVGIQHSPQGASVEALLARADAEMYGRKRRLKSERGH